MRDEKPVRLHARAPLRSLPVGGDPDPSVARDVEQVLAEVLGEPAGIVLTTSCSAAMEAAVNVMDIEPGDEVIVPAFAYPTSVSPFVTRGAVVRFVDSDPLTGGIDAAAVEDKVTSRTRSVVAMHYAGVGAAVDRITPLCERLGLSLLEDAAQGLFGAINGRPLGRWGRFGAISFHRTKNITAVEGGALVINDPADVDAVNAAVDKGTDRVRFMKGLTPSYEWVSTGSSLRMPEVSARYLLADLAVSSDVQKRRHQVWDRYHRALGDWARDYGVGMPTVPLGRSHPAHIFYLLMPDPKDRAPFTTWCTDRGVEVVFHFASLPETSFGRGVALVDDRCPIADSFARRLVRIPLHHQLSDGDVDRVIDVVTSAPVGRF